MSTQEKKTKILFIIIPIAVTLSLIAAMGVMFGVLLNRIENTSTVIVEKEEKIITEKEVRVSTTIRSGIEELGQLITASYWYKHAEYFEDSKKIKDFTIPFTTSSFILECTGEVTAGVDFSKVKVKGATPITITSKGIMVTSASGKAILLNLNDLSSISQE